MIDTKTLQAEIKTAAQNLSEKLPFPQIIVQTEERGKQFVSTVQEKGKQVISGAQSTWTSLPQERRSQLLIGTISVFTALVVTVATILTVRFFQGRK